jgi:hypothetical protein
MSTSHADILRAAGQPEAANILDQLTGLAPAAAQPTEEPTQPPAPQADHVPFDKMSPEQQMAFKGRQILNAVLKGNAR